MALLVGYLAACAPANNPVPVATSTLIAVAPTPTSLPPSATAVASATPSATLAPSASLTPAPLLADGDPLPAALLAEVRADLAQRLGVAPTSIAYVRAFQRRWTAPQLGCDRLGADTEQVTVGYVVWLLVGSAVYAYHTDTAQAYQPCGAPEIMQDELLLLVDPVAAELVALARRQVAQSLNLATRRVVLLAVRPYLWQDSALGCPYQAQVPSPGQFDGYRIVVEAGGQTYAFHTDSERLYPCPLGQERLPLPAPSPTATA